MSVLLAEACKTVISSDLYDRGFGDIGVDFLSAERSANNVITNPPHDCPEGFVRAGLQHSKRKFALLLRLAFLEGANRANSIFSEVLPARVWVFSGCITFYPNGIEVKGSGTTAYTWFVWARMPQAGQS